VKCRDNLILPILPWPPHWQDAHTIEFSACTRTLVGRHVVVLAKDIHWLEPPHW
jgi:hypothetical protein